LSTVANGVQLSAKTLAQAVDHEPTKALLLEMAQQWIKLAEAALDREETGEQVPLSMPRHPQHMTEQ
jgi:hypothetical protein